MNRRRFACARSALCLVAPLTLLAAPGCLDRPVAPQQPSTSRVSTQLYRATSIDKIDLLFMIDNSASMADKQDILADAVPDLVKRLTQPRCMVDKKNAVERGADGNCPAGARPEFKPITDIHVGVISSSLGGAACSDPARPDSMDMSHLITRTQSGGEASSYEDKKFLFWDPEHKGDPPGESNSQAFLANFTEIVRGTGQMGCGFEASLEAWYRFLVDPKPYQKLVPAPCSGDSSDLSCRMPDGVDDAVLKQRADFLRPDSLVAVVMLSDENDCSLMDGSTWAGRPAWVAQLDSFPMFRGTSACQVDPQSPDCMPCNYRPDDPACLAPYDKANDNINLRCFRQKQRFGMDFLWPIKRYVNALTRRTFSKDDIDRGFNQGFEPESDINPLFCSEYEQKPDPENPGSFVVDRSRCSSVMRDPDLVFLAGIIGVPWQDVAADPADLKKGYRPVEELSWTREQFIRYNADDENDEDKLVPGGLDGQLTVWDQIVGTLDSDLNIEYRTDPLDPLMIDSVAGRTGVNPATGQPVAPAESATPDANTINGHEWNAGTEDMQYACTFKLPPGKERQCTPGDFECDCGNPEGKNNPICQSDTGTYGNTQVRAKAYPGRRQLAVLKGIDPKQAIVASICAENTVQPEAADYGYRPAIGAIIDRLKNVLQGTCWNQQLEPDEDGSVQCVVLEATKGERKDDGTYACPPCGTGRSQASRQAQFALAQDSSYQSNDLHCICEIMQAAPGAALDACVAEPEEPPNVDGWCYIDPSLNGGQNQELVSMCPKGKQRMIRFVGASKPVTGSLTFLQCRS